MKKKISAAQRRHQDYLRRMGLKVGNVYRSRLEALRRKEVRRVMGLCADVSDKSQWASIITNNLSEAGYFESWMQGLYVESGLPQAKSIARDLTRGKAETPSLLWESQIRSYATENAGRKIVSVSGTLRDTLIEVLTAELQEDVNVAPFQLSKRIFSKINKLLPWQCLRIAQTETMIALAEGGAVAADSLEVDYLKEWCISGVGNTRESHEIMDGITVGQNEYFELEDCMLLYPHDQSTNPPAGEIINCACSCIRIPK